MELIYEYDGSWRGFLTLIFESFERKEMPDVIYLKGEGREHLFSIKRSIHTDDGKVERVKKGIKKISSRTYSRLLKNFLSEKENNELLGLQLVHLLFSNKYKAENDYRNSLVLKIKQTEKEMGREVHRMHAFVRFQKGKDNIWYAFIEPDFNVLPLIGSHFVKRYADQKWVIYDLTRGYGIYYDLETLSQINISFEDKVKFGELPEEAMSEEEMQYQGLWRNYFESATIKERKNLKLHTQHVPQRYWHLLTEIK